VSIVLLNILQNYLTQLRSWKLPRLPHSFIIEWKPKTFNFLFIATTCFGFPLFRQKKNQFKTIKTYPALYFFTKNENYKLTRSRLWLLSSQGQFLAALAALYLTLVSHWLTECHFRILIQRVTFETWDPSDIWSEWFLDRKTERQKDQKDQKD